MSNSKNALLIVVIISVLGLGIYLFFQKSPTQSNFMMKKILRLRWHKNDGKE